MSANMRCDVIIHTAALPHLEVVITIIYTTCVLPHFVALCPVLLTSSTGHNAHVFGETDFVQNIIDIYRNVLIHDVVQYLS